MKQASQLVGRKHSLRAEFRLVRFERAPTTRPRVADSCLAPSGTNRLTSLFRSVGHISNRRHRSPPSERWRRFFFAPIAERRDPPRQIALNGQLGPALLQLPRCWASTSCAACACHSQLPHFVDLIAMAFQTDSTRVITLDLPGSNQVFSTLKGVSDGHLSPD